MTANQQVRDLIGRAPAIALLVFDAERAGDHTEFGQIAWVAERFGAGGAEVVHVLDLVECAFHQSAPLNGRINLQPSSDYEADFAIRILYRSYNAIVARHQEVTVR